MLINWNNSNLTFINGKYYGNYTKLFPLCNKTFKYCGFLSFVYLLNNFFLSLIKEYFKNVF